VEDFIRQLISNGDQYAGFMFSATFDPQNAICLNPVYHPPRLFIFFNDPTMSGSVTGVSPAKVICRNLDTRQTVIIDDHLNSWDCMAAGLAFSFGDRIDIIVKGTAD